MRRHGLRLCVLQHIGVHHQLQIPIGLFDGIHQQFRNHVQQLCVHTQVNALPLFRVQTQLLLARLSRVRLRAGNARQQYGGRAQRQPVHAIFKGFREIAASHHVRVLKAHHRAANIFVSVHRRRRITLDQFQQHLPQELHITARQPEAKLRALG